MTPQDNTNYLVERNQAENENDLLSRLLFLLRQSQDINTQKLSENGQSAMKSDEATRGLLREAVMEILARMDKTEIQEAIQTLTASVNEGNRALFDVLLEIAQKNNNDTVSAVQAVEQATLANMPIDMRMEIVEVKTAVEGVARLVANIKMPVIPPFPKFPKFPEFPKIPEFRLPDIFNVRGKVSVEKPEWYSEKDYSERLDKIESVLEKILKKEFPKFPKPQELPIRNGKVLVSVDRVGGGGSSTFGGTTTTEEIWQEAYGKGIVDGAFHYWGFSFGEKWRIKARAKEDITVGSTDILKGEIFWKSGLSGLETAWANKAVETHLSDYRRQL